MVESSAQRRPPFEEEDHTHTAIEARSQRNLKSCNFHVLACHHHAAGAALRYTAASHSCTPHLLPQAIYPPLGPPRRADRVHRRTQIALFVFLRLFCLNPTRERASQIFCKRWRRVGCEPSQRLLVHIKGRRGNREAASMLALVEIGEASEMLDGVGVKGINAAGLRLRVRRCGWAQIAEPPGSFCDVEGIFICVVRSMHVVGAVMKARFRAGTGIHDMCFFVSIHLHHYHAIHTHGSPNCT